MALGEKFQKSLWCKIAIENINMAIWLLPCFSDLKKKKKKKKKKKTQACRKICWVLLEQFVSTNILWHVICVCTIPTL